MKKQKIQSLKIYKIPTLKNKFKKTLTQTFQHFKKLCYKN